MRAMAADSGFDQTFLALTGNDPFPWQCAMYREMVEGRPPRSCQIPTGLGKTAVMAVWLIALANRQAVVPRRLVYVVNRRTVVDQSTKEAEKLKEKLEDLPALRDGFGTLAISTLRGQFEDNREWSADPSRPAIIVGTVDMIGSRLLFSGYRIGFKLKPLHAGFLGQDVLLIHDEAHLEPAFQSLLYEIEREQERSKDFRPIRVMALSATSRDGECFRLTDKDRAHPEVKKRFEARKALDLHPIEDEKKVSDRLAELALRYNEARRTVLVFARTVEAVEDVAKKLEKAAPGRVARLTGTMRGKERDELVEKAVFRRFLPDGQQDEETVYLLCTSAGEVGVNISADHLVCDLTTFDSMAQRFGRVNRFGSRDDTRIDVVHPVDFGDDDYESARAKTLGLLEELDGNASPAALDGLEAGRRSDAFSPLPVILPVSDILLDAWAFTTIRGKLPGRPPVGPYLHGVSDEPAETYVAWRDEVELIRTPALLDRYPPGELLADFPLKPHELLRDRSGRVFDRLASLGKAHPDKPAWRIDEEGTVKLHTLADLGDKDKKDRLEGATILLSPWVGGLGGGMLTGDPDDVVHDVSAEWFYEQDRRRRQRVRSHEGQPRIPEGMRLLRTIDTRPDQEDEAVGPESDGDGGSSGRYWHWYDVPKSADDDLSKTARRPVPWCAHTEDVIRRAREIVRDLDLPSDLERALIVAAEGHDLGKKRIVWQRSIGNPRPTDWLAKSGMLTTGVMMKAIESSTYRHEFGSLHDVRRKGVFQELSPELQDLVLHLIAVHHGLGRPHFPEENLIDPHAARHDSDAIAAEVPLRFARLQAKYGRWGLAYLESLLRAADYAASADPSQTVEVEP